MSLLWHVHAYMHVRRERDLRPGSPAYKLLSAKLHLRERPYQWGACRCMSIRRNTHALSSPKTPHLHVLSWCCDEFVHRLTWYICHRTLHSELMVASYFPRKAKLIVYNATTTCDCPCNPANQPICKPLVLIMIRATKCKLGTHLHSKHITMHSTAVLQQLYKLSKDCSKIQVNMQTLMLTWS